MRHLQRSTTGAFIGLLIGGAAMTAAVQATPTDMSFFCNQRRQAQRR